MYPPDRIMLDFCMDGRCIGIILLLTHRGILKSGQGFVLLSYFRNIELSDSKQTSLVEWLSSGGEHPSMKPILATARRRSPIKGVNEPAYFFGRKHKAMG